MTMLARLRTETNRHLRHLGFQLERFFELPGGRRFRMMQHHGIQTVIDVGGNVGNYGRELRYAGYRGRIISFEPTATAYQTLAARASDDPAWIVIKAALGETEGEVTIHVAANEAASSSILPMRDVHLRIAPGTGYVSSERVRLMTLDQALEGLLAPADRALLKIDVQGYEAKILEGASRVLRQVELIECELSFISLYDGQPLFEEMLALLRSLGFNPVQFSPGFTDRTTGYNLQVDGIFSKTEIG
jgi:FkbM family methyltransferase